MSEEIQQTNPNWYKELQYKDVKVYIRDNINSASRSFVAIGYYLKYVRDNQLYSEDGYTTIWEFAQGEFSIGKSSASRFMAINDRFSNDGNSPILLEQYRDFSSSKLSEILQTESDQISVKPPLNELEVENVRRMYHDEAKTMKEVAEYYGVPKARLNSYITRHNLRRTSYNKASYSDPVDSEKPKPEPLRAQSNVKKCRVCGKDIIINPKMTWVYKYGRKQNGKAETVYCCSRDCLGIGKMKDA